MRKTIIILSCCVGLMLLGYSGCRGYETWKQSHGMAMAREYFAKGDAKHHHFLPNGASHKSPEH